MDRDRMLDEYRFLHSEILVQMVEVEADQYHPEAIELAIEILAERGIVGERPGPEGAGDKQERAGDLAHSGYVHVLWGGALCLLGVALSVGSGGAVIFYGAALVGGAMVVNGLAMRGGAERLEAQARIIRTSETTAGPGSLSPVDADPDIEGSLSLEPKDTDKADD